MQRRVVVVSAVAAVLGLSAAALGFAAEAFNRKALVASDGFRCEYWRTPALACGILAALLALAGAALVTAASGCFGRCRPGNTVWSVAGTWRGLSIKLCATIAWMLVAAATVMFLFGASRNAGGTGGLSYRRSPRRSPRGGDGGGAAFDFVCTELKGGVFSTASIATAVGIACAVAAYVELEREAGDEPHAQSIAMGQLAQLQWSQPYPPPPVAYPASAPPSHGGYSAKQPAATA